MSANHAMSVFTHSCLSTPRNPRTRLPSDSMERNMDLSHPPTSQIHTRASGTKPLESLHVATSPRVLDSSRMHDRQTKWNLVGRPAVLPNSEDLSTGNERTNPVSDYSTLFSALLESNALLHKEIHKLHEQHQKTLTTVESLCQQQLQWKVEAQHMTADIRDGHGLSGSTRGVMVAASDLEGLSDEERLSQSLPARLLHNTWVQSSDQDGSSRAASSSTTSSLQHSSHTNSYHSDQHSDQQQQSVLVPTGEDKSEEKSGDVEGSDEEEVESVSSAHDLSAHGFHSSTNSLSSSADSTRPHTPYERAEGDPFASPGVLAIEHMWDDFSVEEIAPYEPDMEQETKGRSKEWSPTITIPEPFSMTLRDSKTPKRKSRSMLIAERERMEREAQEEAELKKQFRATPVPASTYLPLYELLNAKNEQRREQVKKLSQEILKSTEKPFSFMKREEEKKALRTETARISQEFARMKARKERQFQAKPIQQHLFDPMVNEQIREQEEYRRIRIKMRAEQLLSSSKLPGSMQVKGREYTVGSLRKKRLEKNQNRAFMTQEHQFHPAVNGEVPDYDQAYLDFQTQLAKVKKTKKATVTDPFYLRTQLIPSRKEQVVEDVKKDERLLPETRWPFIASRRKVSHKSTTQSCAPRSRSSTTPYPAQLTKSFKLHQSLTQDRLKTVAEEERAAAELVMTKKRQRDALQRTVSQKSNPTVWLEETKQQKQEKLRYVDSSRHPVVLVSL